MLAKQKVFLRSQFNYDTDHASESDVLHCADPSLTRQSEAEEADINTIVRRFGVTGVLPEVPRPPVYGDFTEHVNDFQTAQNMIISAEKSFMSLPAEIRQQFGHSAANWVEFVSTASEEELAKFNVKPAEEGRTAVVPVPGTTPAGPLETPQQLGQQLSESEYRTLLLRKGFSVEREHI